STAQRPCDMARRVDSSSARLDIPAQHAREPLGGVQTFGRFRSLACLGRAYLLMNENMSADDKIIKSRSNPTIHLARQVRDGKLRKEIFLEGLRLCEEALRADLEIHQALATEKISREERGHLLLEELRQREIRISIISEQVMNFISA